MKIYKKPVQIRTKIKVNFYFLYIETKKYPCSTLFGQNESSILEMANWTTLGWTFTVVPCPDRTRLHTKDVLIFLKLANTTLLTIITE